jgi:hypothetical protein
MKRMTQAEFARDPQVGLRHAKNGGLVITDARGRPRGILSVPGPMDGEVAEALEILRDKMSPERREACAVDLFRQIGIKAGGDWDYRIMRRHRPAHTVGRGRARRRVKAETWFGIYEVYYNEAGEPHSWTEDPIELNAESLDELRGDLHHMLKAFARPVLDFDGKASPAQIEARRAHLTARWTSKKKRTT